MRNTSTQHEISQRERRIRHYRRSVQNGRAITWIPSDADEEQFLALTRERGPTVSGLEARTMLSLGYSEDQNSDESITRRRMFMFTFDRNINQFTDVHKRLLEAIVLSSGPIKDKAAMKVYADSRRERYDRRVG